MKDNVIVFFFDSNKWFFGLDSVVYFAELCGLRDKRLSCNTAVFFIFFPSIEIFFSSPLVETTSVLLSADVLSRSLVFDAMILMDGFFELWSVIPSVSSTATARTARSSTTSVPASDFCFNFKVNFSTRQHPTSNCKTHE